MTKQTFIRIGLLSFLTVGGIVGGVVANRKAQAHGDDNHDKFSVHDFKGNYGMLETGQVEGAPFVEVSLVQADGAGHIKISAIANLGGGAAGITTTLTCTYTVRPNGMGQVNCKDDNSGELSNADFVIDDGGREVKMISTPDPHGYTSSVATRQ